MIDLNSFTTVLCDVDGTLIDSNGAHAITWSRALREYGFDRDVDRVRQLIGVGGDKFLPEVARVEESSALGTAISARKKTLFNDFLSHLKATQGARELMAFLRHAGKTVVIATSADDAEMEALLKQANVDDLIEHRTSKDDASRSKPDPDIVRAALEKVQAHAIDAVMIGDTPYDVEAARRANVRAIALRSGGYWTDAAFAAADAIFDAPDSLLRHWQQPRTKRPTCTRHG